MPFSVSLHHHQIRAHQRHLPERVQSLGRYPSAGGVGLKVKRGKIARRQLRLQVEEEQWVEEMLKRCWDQLQSGMPEHLGPTQAQSLDAVLKDEPTVSVNEVPSG